MIKEEVPDSRTLPTSKPMPPSIITSRRTVPNFGGRSIYRFRCPHHPQPVHDHLGLPGSRQFHPKRLNTTTPLQSLALYNNDFMLRQAGYLAERIETAAGPNLKASRSGLPYCLQPPAKRGGNGNFESVLEEENLLFSADPSSTQTNFSTSTRLK